MNTALWVVQGLLAAMFLLAGGFKLFTPLKSLEKKMLWVQMFPAWAPKAVGLAEILGAAGLVLPWYLGIAPVLTPIAALCLSLLMDGAVITHLKLKESPLPALIPGALATLVFVMRMFF
jgi:hypothetical protein